MQIPPFVPYCKNSKCLKDILPEVLDVFRLNNDILFTIFKSYFSTFYSVVW